MSKISALAEADISFLKPYLPPAIGLREPQHNRKDDSQTAEQPPPPTHQDESQSAQDRPFVTLTYASSLDGMISLSPGLRTTLSGPETKSVGTAIPDDPSLNCRYPDASLETQPRPVIVDPLKRFHVKGSKVAQLAAEGKGKIPWLLHVGNGNGITGTDEAACERIYIDAGRDKTAPSVIAWPLILKALKQYGIDSVMIEGGATIISTLLCMPELVDSVIVTIAPTWLGQGGVSIAPAATVVGEERFNSATLEQTAWRQFGADAVLCGRLQLAV
ncbi:2,5-diamino-6-(ribosylamino)-4(3H)-pyrimidinone 5'-phosphate reductase [Friedmanniomyces endolithicus]|nr:2,5-diamino-6-(ribosylamino)-4(3H)-pyrimidinone 5'-phosphate reductase [Friedmanniomyces endolithicus]KAK1813971.1 2,5-diamino-6-(ribosylamino)-4(3H)-pyrimidinone 5'-phosphate reductase [Friedmanniomyces endolithicus]